MRLLLDKNQSALLLLCFPFSTIVMLLLIKLYLKKMLEKWDITGSSIGLDDVEMTMVSGCAGKSQNLTQEYDVSSRKLLLSKDQLLMINPNLVLEPQYSFTDLVLCSGPPRRNWLFYGKSTDGIFFQANWQLSKLLLFRQLLFITKKFPAELMCPY